MTSFHDHGFPPKRPPPKRPPPPPNTPSAKGEPTPPLLREVKDGRIGDLAIAIVFLIAGFVWGGSVGLHFGTRDGLRMKRDSDAVLDRALALHRKTKALCQETPSDVEM